MIRQRDWLYWMWLGIGGLQVILIFWGCLTPAPPKFNLPLPDADKFEHAGAYLLLGAWFGALINTSGKRIGLFVILAFMGGLLEILQLWSGYRDAEWLDWAADMFGAVIGIWLLSYPGRFVYRGLGRLVVQPQGHDSA